MNNFVVDCGAVICPNNSSVQRLVQRFLQKHWQHREQVGVIEAELWSLSYGSLDEAEFAELCDQIYGMKNKCDRLRLAVAGCQRPGILTDFENKCLILYACRYLRSHCGIREVLPLWVDLVNERVDILSAKPAQRSLFHV